MRDDVTEFRRAERIGAIEISAIVQISEAAADLRAKGRDIIALSTGAPDYPTPDFVIEAAHKAALTGQTGYTATLGTPSLRAAIAREHSTSSDRVIVSSGAKQVLANALLATLDPGDEVVIPVPSWTTYFDIVGMAGGSAVRVVCPMAREFKLTPEALAAAITRKTRWVMLNSPSNPSGAVYSPAELRALAEVMAAHSHVWVLSDEIYEHLSYAPFSRFVDVNPELADRTLTVSGVSKAWAMTGWRIGWGVGPQPLIRAMGAVQGQVTSGASSISQAAAMAALEGDRSLLAERLAGFDARRQLMVAGLNAMPGITCPLPDGAFYAFPDLSGAMERTGFDTCTDFCRWLLDTVGVAVVPGVAFGLPGHARLSFAYRTDDLTRGLSLIQQALSR